MAGGWDFGRCCEVVNDASPLFRGGLGYNKRAYVVMMRGFVDWNGARSMWWGVICWFDRSFWCMRSGCWGAGVCLCEGCCLLMEGIGWVVVACVGCMVVHDGKEMR